MTENLKCPFCGVELIPQNDIENTEPIRANCINPRCAWFMWSFPWEIWHALIDGKKAQDALKSIADDMVLCRPALDLQNNIPWKKHYFRLKDKAKSAITSITKQEE